MVIDDLLFNIVFNIVPAIIASGSRPYKSFARLLPQRACPEQPWHITWMESWEVPTPPANSKTLLGANLPDH